MLQIDDVSFAYKQQKKEQLSHITLTIQPGEFVLLCGKSGCGKTTLTKLINGLIPHFIEGEYSGRVLLSEQDTRNLKTYQIAEHVGSIFQNPKTQFFNLDTDSELAFGLENMGTDSARIRTRVGEVTQELEMEGLLRRGVFQLSGGEKQFLAVASVYAADPQIYVFDEPSANIDEQGIERIRQILFKLKKQRKTILIAEHRLYYFMDLLDRAVYLKDGNIEFVYSNKEFKNISDTRRCELGLRTFYPIDMAVCQNMKPKPPGVLLTITNLTCCYRNKPVIHRATLSADKGDVIAVTGTNGTGKSTFMRCLCGLIKESGGTVTYQNKTYNHKQRRSLCYMIMQDVVHQLFAESVKQEFQLLNHTVSEDKITEILTEFDLNRLMDKHPMTLSGGQMQRLAIAVAFLSDRDIIVFDEPTSGLDYTNMLVVSRMMKKLSESKIVFIITHDKELVHEACSRILHLADGKITEVY